MRITQFRIKNFRCLPNVELTFRPFTVIIGPNGAGKSSLLEGLSAICNLRKKNLLNSISRWGGFTSVLNYRALETDPIMQIGVSLESNKEILNYDLKLRGESASYFVETEVLTAIDRDSMSSRNLMVRKGTQCIYDSSDGKIGQKMGFPHGPNLALEGTGIPFSGANTLQTVLGKTSYWPIHKFQLNERTRGPQQLQPTQLPADDGSDLLSAIYTLKSDRKRDFLGLLESMQNAIPELEEIEFPLVAAGNVVLKWRQVNLPRELYLHQLSDGTIRLLWLMTILHTVPDDGLVLIDEPELSLHPQWLLLAVSTMRKVSARTNIVVATQSPEFLRWVDPNELLIADIKESGSEFSWANERSDIDTWLKDFALSELWTMGELGGRR